MYFGESGAPLGMPSLDVDYMVGRLRWMVFGFSGGKVCVRDSLSVTIKNQQNRVYFLESSEIHENHYGRCTPDGFACGLRDTDVWHKLIDGRTALNEFVLTRSYHMDCEPDWTFNDTPELLSPEQQNMLDLGLPLSFGHANTYSRRSDDAIVGELESLIVERDYDKELADLSSSTEQMSLSRSSRPESGELMARDEMCGSSTSPSDVWSGLTLWDPVPGSMTIEAFDEYWAINGERILESEWQKQYGEYMIPTATISEAADCSDGDISSERDEEKQQAEMNYSYAEEWEKVWVQFGTRMYYTLMEQLVAQEELAGYKASQHNVSMSINEGSVGQGSSKDVGELRQKNEEDETSSNKRKLSVRDFGASMTGESCSIQNRFIKNHRLKKIKRESHNHRKNPNVISADALEDAPKDARLAKYWSQRYRLFRKFDDGIQMDDEGWFSVTPEKIAEHIANRMCPRSLRKTMLTMDAFCGVGGNTIQLAMRSRIVLAVDIDPNKIAMAKNNARVYGVDQKVQFVLADMAHFVPRVAPDVIFMSPPWGGPDYKNKPSFDLRDMCVDVRAIFHAYENVSPDIAFILPRNTKVDQLCELGRVEVEQNMLNKKIKTITAYYGNLICK
ncbi:hypothetical protein BIW11_13915 [Tropilaelaps mercedesae]|uniref:Trimethylguanosine synthase n=1 Tax=Tropilaelaps mercedesae TaxID=418985 RepID=A0A1V9X086_9ACAR|nr:hypothetical protein BIW11_13915 [Tropilaelaps mercedesae]